VKFWNVHCERQLIGVVEADTKEAARIAAFSKYALTGDEMDALVEKGQPILGIPPDWGFSVTPTEERLVQNGS
jgi:hypothetical protein